MNNAPTLLILCVLFAGQQTQMESSLNQNNRASGMKQKTRREKGNQHTTNSVRLIEQRHAGDTVFLVMPSKNVYSGEAARTTAPYASHCTEKRALMAAAQNYFAAVIIRSLLEA